MATPDNASNRANPSYESGGYSKIIAIFNRNDKDTSVASRNNRVNIALKHSANFDQTIANINPDSFYKVAGADLSTIFMPFETVLKPSGMPCFHPQAPSGHVSGVPISAYELRPFNWDISKSNYVYNRYLLPSGDSLPNLLSGETYRSNPDQLRDISDIRAIGLRMPMMGVGWGYDLNGIPVPSGHGTDSNGNVNKFKGEVDNGWQVDPINYISAPIDIRYDGLRHVWTCVGTIPPGSGRYKVLQLIDDGYPADYTWQYPRFH